MKNIEKSQKYFEKQKYEKAIFYAQGIKTKKTYYILAESYFAQKKYQKAIPYYECLLKNKIKDPWLANHLSQSYEAVGEYKKAITAGFLSIQYAPFDNAHHINFAYLLYECNNLQATKKWQKMYPKNPVVNHFSKAILSQQKNLDSNPEYIKAIFDNFSFSFDDVLSTLSYQAPEHIRALFAKNKIKNANVIDIGCGTGLCGKLIKKYCKKRGLTGLDISPKMLEVASSKRIYNHIIEADINLFLEHNKTLYDCVVASDVLTYFNNLSPVIKGICNTLVNNGYFAFTITKNTTDSNDVLLHSSGRFRHSKKYIKQVLKESGFYKVEISEKSLRFEGDEDVFGYVILAQKKAL